MAVSSHLRSLQALQLAMRTGSLTAAAEALAITPAAVGQRIKALEDYLGVELMLRGRGGIRAAPALIEALPLLDRAFAELDGAAKALEMQRGQELHVAGPSDFIDLWLKPRLSAFRKLYPRVMFCLNGEGDTPLRLGQIDCRIEFEMPRAGTSTEPLFRDLVIPVGTPTNVERTAGLPFHMRLEGFPLLHVDFYKDDPAEIGWPKWTRHNGLTRTAPERGIRFQRIKAALESILADAGFALIGIAMMREPLEERRIAFPYPLHMAVWTQQWFTASFRTDHRPRLPVRAFRQWLLAEAQGTRTWLETLVTKAASDRI